MRSDEGIDAVTTTVGGVIQASTELVLHEAEVERQLFAVGEESCEVLASQGYHDACWR